ncbi:hypothetical protein PENTCL1PPCAC_30355, partial [Pristionchus entomophagus]
IMPPRRTKSVIVVSQKDPLVEHKLAAKKFLDAEQSVLTRIESVVKAHAGDVTFLSFEDKRVPKLYSCSFRCRHCVVSKCGLMVWREPFSPPTSFRFMSPLNWIDDPEDALLSSLIDVLRKLPSVPPLLILSLPRSCYESHKHLIVGLSLVMDQLPVRQIHVFLSNSGDRSFHFGELSKLSEENACRTVQEVARLQMPDGTTWRTSVGLPLYNMVDIISTHPTNPLEVPSTFFVLARNAAGEVTYRTSDFLPDEMWNERDWSAELPRMMREYELTMCDHDYTTLEAPEAEFPLFDSTIVDEEIEQKMKKKKRKHREDTEEKEFDVSAFDVKEEWEEEGVAGPSGLQNIKMEADTPVKKKRKSDRPRKLANKAGAVKRQSLRECNDRVKMEETTDTRNRSRSTSVQTAVWEEKKGGKRASRKRGNNKPATERKTKKEVKTKGEESEMRMSEEEEEYEDKEERNPYGAVTVFPKTHHAPEQRRAMSAKILPTVPKLRKKIEKVIEQLEENGDATENLINQWKRMIELVKPQRKNESLMEVFDEIASKMKKMTIVHPELSSEVFFHL